MIMKNYLIYLFSLVNLLCPINFSLSSVKARELSIPIVAKLSAASVVRIWGAGASGSGVVVSMPKNNGIGRKNVIFTAYHVVSKLGKDESIEIELPNGEFIEIPSKSVKKVGDLDLAFITLPEDISKISNLKSVTIANSNAIEFGQSIVIAGFPIETSSNISNKVRIKPGFIQTFSEKGNKNSLVGYDAKTVPGMSGGGVFSMEGKLLLIHLRGEKDLWETNLEINGRPLKSGTNYGIPALLALKEAQKETLKNFKVESPLDEFKKGLYFVENNKIEEAYAVFKNLSGKYPDSLVAEWNAACMNLQLKYPNGAPEGYFRLRSKASKDFFDKHKVKPVYKIPFTSDSMIWDADERLTLLSFDPIYNLAIGADIIYLNRGSYIDLNSERDKCEKIVGLKEYFNRGINETELHWRPIYN